MNKTVSDVKARPAMAGSETASVNGAPRDIAGNRVRVPKTAELIAATFRRQIVRGDLRQGDALPSETVLMEQFGVSRPTLREAFRLLESESLISIRRGSHGGARVEIPNDDVAARYAGLVLEYRGTTLADVYEARAVLEPPCVGLLASRRTAADLRVLWAAVEEAESLHDDPHQAAQVQTDFHSLIIDRAGNETVRVLCGMLRHIIDTATVTRVEQVMASPEAADATHSGARSHRRLVELIEARDAEGAERVWRRHLTETSRFLLGAPTAETVLDLLD
jgi:DNA-binding FadR family transcriptional regulator